MGSITLHKECKTYGITYTDHFYIYSERKKKRIDMGARIIFKYGSNEYDIEGRSLNPNDQIKYVTVGEKETLFKTGFWLPDDGQ